MNIQPFQAQAPAVASRPVGGRLDIRSDTPALSHAGPAKTPARQPTPEIGSLAGVLNPQERQALAAAFGQTEAPVYSGRGTNVDNPPVLGSQLDFQA